MGWFEKLTGFRELPYEETRAKLRVEGYRLHSLANGKSWAIGKLEMASLQTLRERVGPPGVSSGRLRARIIRGDVKALHSAPEYVGALIQAASQFNALEMTGPEVTPEDGVARYEYDRTQGPACAIAAGAATIYRNYFVPVAGGIGQTAERQLDGLAGVGAALNKATGKRVTELWYMRNGYAMCSASGMDTISRALAAMDAKGLDGLRGKLAIAVHTGVEVTVGAGEPGPLVSQAFCAALPVGYFNFRDREAGSKLSHRSSWRRLTRRRCWRRSSTLGEAARKSCC